MQPTPTRAKSSANLPSPSLRDRKKERTRLALFEAALTLFADKGFDATTIDEIAAAAEVSRRTFFRYFAAKEAVVFPWDEPRLALFREILADRRPGEDRFERIRRALMALAGEYMEQARDMLAQHKVVESSPALLAYERKLDRRWEEALAEALAVGARSERQRRRARIVAGAMMGAIRATLAEWFAMGAKGDLKTMGDAALDLIEAGARE